jgi:serine/threonine protein kinase
VSQGSSQAARAQQWQPIALTAGFGARIALNSGEVQSVHSFLLRVNHSPTVPDFRWQIESDGLSWTTGIALQPLSALLAARGALRFADELSWTRALVPWLQAWEETPLADVSSLWLSEDLQHALWIPLRPGCETATPGPTSAAELLVSLVLETVKGFPPTYPFRATDCIGLPQPLVDVVNALSQTPRSLSVSAVVERLWGATQHQVVDGTKSLTRTGKRIGAYDVFERIGEGGMGEVYRARHIHLGSVVALKFLKAELCADPMLVSRFFDEARLAHQLKHRNIVPVTDFVNAGSDVYFAMAFLEGQPLSTLMANERAISPLLAAKWIREVCAALSVAHGLKIVHRDIKPENIFLSKTAEGYEAKLLDFGIAKSLHPKHANRTQTGMVMGTLRYMSPEQAQGRPVDARSDIYSVAAVLYELLTGRAVHDEPRPLSNQLSTTSGVDVAPELKDLIVECLNLEPSLRPQRIDALLTALSQPAFVRVQKRAQGKVWKIALSVVGLFALTAAMILGGWSMRSTETTKPSEPERSGPTNDLTTVTAPIAVEPEPVVPPVAATTAPLEGATSTKRKGRPAISRAKASAGSEKVASAEKELSARMTQLRNRFSALEQRYGSNQLTSLERTVVNQAWTEYQAKRYEDLSMTLSDAEEVVRAAEKRLER